MRMLNVVTEHQKGRLYGCGGKLPCMLTVFTGREKFRPFHIQENIQDAPLETDGLQNRYGCGDSVRISIRARNKTLASQTL